MTLVRQLIKRQIRKVHALPTISLNLPEELLFSHRRLPSEIADDSTFSHGYSFYIDVNHEKSQIHINDTMTDWESGHILPKYRRMLREIHPNYDVITTGRCA